MPFESIFELIGELFRIIKGESPSIFDKGLRECRDEGEAGEYAIKYALTNNNLKGEFIVLENVYVPIKDGTRTTEIDILMLHEKGIFVLESKNYSGSIYGGDDELYWVQYLNRNNKNKFYNPIRQNETHIKALAEFLDMPSESFCSFLVFSKRCELRKVPNDKITYSSCVDRICLKSCANSLRLHQTLMQNPIWTRWHKSSPPAQTSAKK